MTQRTVDELGRIAAKNTVVFGFVRPTTKPCRSVRLAREGVVIPGRASLTEPR